MTPERRKEVEKVEKKVQAEEQDQKSKSPTLLKPGERLSRRNRADVKQTLGRGVSHLG